MRYKEFVESNDMFATRGPFGITGWIKEWIARIPPDIDENNEIIDELEKIAQAFQQGMRTGLEAWAEVERSNETFWAGELADIIREKSGGRISLYQECERWGVPLEDVGYLEPTTVAELKVLARDFAGKWIKRHPDWKPGDKRYDAEWKRFSKGWVDNLLYRTGGNEPKDQEDALEEFNRQAEEALAKISIKESDDLFATRPGARIADYIDQLADHSDFLDPEEIPVVKTVARAFRRDIQSGLQAFEAMDPTVNDHIYGMVAKNLGIDLYDEAEKVGIDLSESDDDMFAPRIASRIAQHLENTAEEYGVPSTVQTIRRLAQAFRQGQQKGLKTFQSIRNGELQWNLQIEIEDQLGIDLEQECQRAGLAESDDLFAQGRQRTAQKPVKPPQPKLSAPIIDQKIMGYIPANSVKFDGIDWKDPGDLADVYVDAATFADGTPLNDAQRERLTNELERTGQLLEIVGEMWHDWAENWGQV